MSAETLEKCSKHLSLVSSTIFIRKKRLFQRQRDNLFFM